jgi:hypothetical protein
MATPGAEFVTFGRKARLTPSGNTEAEQQELEKEIAGSRDWPIDSLLDQVVSRVSSIADVDVTFSELMFPVCPTTSMVAVGLPNTSGPRRETGYPPKVNTNPN